MSTNTHYTTKNQIEELREAYQLYVKEAKRLKLFKRQIDAYIYFLHSVEGYPKNQIANQLYITRERVAQIIKNAQKKIKQLEGGETS